MFKNYDKTTIVVVTVCIVLLLSWNQIFGPSGLDWMPKEKKEAAIKKKEKTESKSPSSKENKTIKKIEPSNKEDKSSKSIKSVQQKSPSPISTKSKPKTEPKSISTASSEKVSNKKLKSQTQQDKTTNNIEKIATAKSKINYPDLKRLQRNFSKIKLNPEDSPIMLRIEPVKGEIASIKMKDYYDNSKKKKVILNKNVNPGALSISGYEENWKLLKVYPPKINKDKNQIIVRRKFREKNGQNFIVKQIWQLNDNYKIDYNISITNKSNDPINFQSLFVWIGGLPPQHFLTGDQIRSESHILDALKTNGDIYSLHATDSDFKNNIFQFNPIKWLAVSNKYFTCILKPSGTINSINGGNFNRRYKKTIKENGKTKDFYVLSSAARLKNIDIPSENSKSWKFKYYAGPKEIKNLNGFAPKASDIMHLSWSLLDLISQWLLYALIFIKGYVGNFGLAIISLTLIVKIIFWPITSKSNKSMKKMQKIQPMIKELREKYKDDKQMLNTKMMELYKKEKVNPLGGCLPILVQIPVFIALYWTLIGAIELRHAHFLWATDLSRPDTIANIWLGFGSLPINPFAIMMALTMVVQQKFTPTATDPTQAKMMMFMPIIMLIFLYNLPSGLTLYWTVSQVLAIAQLFYNKYQDSKEPQKAKTA